MDADDDGSMAIPKGTIAKFIKLQLPDNVRCSNETRELLSQCATEFINLLSSEANEVCSKRDRNKITSDHLFEALTTLGFSEYTEDMKNIGDEATTGKKQRTKKSKGKDTGKTDEQLAREQELKFAQARHQTGSSLSTLHTAPSEEAALDDEEDDDDEVLDDDD